MSSRKFATLEPEEQKQVIDGIYSKLEPQITKAVGQYLSTIEPSVRKIVRDEIGRFAVTEKQAQAFLDGMMMDAAQKAAAHFRPKWLRHFFRWES